MFIQIESYGEIETLGDLMKAVDEIGDVDPKTRVEVELSDLCELQLMENPVTKERYINIEAL